MNRTCRRKYFIDSASDQPIKQGCSFAGWSKKKSSSDMWQFAEDRITDNITLYAIWTEKTASILEHRRSDDRG